MNCYDFGQQFEEDFYPNFGVPFDSSHVPATLERQQTNNVWKKKAPVIKRLLRLLYILSFAAFLMTAVSCGSGVDYHPSHSPLLETATPTDIYELSVSIEEQVIIEEQGVKITALSIYDTYESPILSILIENNGKSEIDVTLWHARVNGNALHHDDMKCIVEAGKSETADIALFAYNVVTIRDIELGFRIHDSVAMTDTNYDAITIKTFMKETATQANETDDPATQGKNGIIYKEGGITIYVGSFQESSSADDSPTFKVGVANDSDHEVNAYFRNFVVNGQAVEFAYQQFHQIREGNAWDEFIFFESDELAYLGITAFETVDFQLEVRSSDEIAEKIRFFNISLSIPESTGDEFEFIYPEITAEVEDVEAEAKAFAYSVNEQVLCDQDGIRLTVASLDTTDKDPHFGTVRLGLLMENNTEGQVFGEPLYVAINGVMVGASFYDSNFIRIIDSGVQTPCYINISNESLITAGIQTIKDIEFRLELSQLSAYREQNRYSVFAKISTTAPESFVQTLDGSGKVILDQDGVKVVAQGLHKDFFSTEVTSFVKLYVENNSDRIVDFDLSDVTVNGEGIEPPNMYLTVYPSKVAYGKIEFRMGELDYGDSLAFRLLMRDADSYEKIFETDDISLTFQQ